VWCPFVLAAVWQFRQLKALVLPVVWQAAQD
jgi:hypothetical protein